jgi:hypothetical protein
MADVIAILEDLDALPYAAPSLPKKPKKPALRPLSEALKNAAERLQEKRTELKTETNVQTLVRRYKAAFLAGKRIEAFALSERLAELETQTRHSSMPPCFRLEDPKHAELTQQQQFDLLAHDLQWIVAKWPEQQAKAHGDYKRLLGDDPERWLPVAEFHWARKEAGNRYGNIAHVVNRMELSEAQQWECLTLRHKHIRGQSRALTRRKVTVKRALEEKLAKAEQAVRGKHKPKTAYDRRFMVWVCAVMTTCDRMTKPSPTKAANLYRAWTGEPLDRRIALQDLEWMAAYIPASKRKSRQTKESRDQETKE